MTLACEVRSALEWQAASLGLGGGSLTQTWAYGAARAMTGPWSPERLRIVKGGDTIGLAQVMRRRLGPLRRPVLGWVSRGPIVALDVDREASLQHALTLLRQHLVQQQNLYLRILPDLPREVVAPAAEGAGLSTVRESAGWSSARVCLEADEPMLRARLEKKWRNRLSKGESAGIEVTADRPGALGRFLSAYDHELRTARFSTSITPRFISALAGAGGREVRLRVLEAWHGETGVGWVAIAQWNARSEYFAAVVSEPGRAMNAGHCLLWRAMLDAKAAGCGTFDMGGMSDATPAGIYHFKRGLAGEPYEHAEELEGHDGSVRHHLLRWALRWTR